MWCGRKGDPCFQKYSSIWLFCSHASYFLKKSSYGGVHSDFLVGYCSPVNCKGIVRGRGFILVSWNYFQEGGIIQGIFGESVLVGCVSVRSIIGAMDVSK